MSCLRKDTGLSIPVAKARGFPPFLVSVLLILIFAVVLSLMSLARVEAQSAPPVPAVPAASNAAPSNAAPSNAAPGAKTFTLAQIVSLAVNSSTSVVLARQRLQQAQEQVFQINAQGRPQFRGDAADTYTSYANSATTLPATNLIQNPVLPGGNLIPPVIDQAGVASTAFGGAGATAGGVSVGATAGGVTTGAPAGASGTGVGGTTLGTPGSTGVPTTTPGITGGTPIPAPSAPGAATPTPGGGAPPGTVTPGAATPGTGATPATPALGTGNTPGNGAPTGSPSGGGGAVPSGNGAGVSGAAPQAQVELAPLPSIVQQFVTETDDTALGPRAARVAAATSGDDATKQPRDAAAPTVNPAAVGERTRNNYGARITLAQYIDAFGLLSTARSAEKATRDFYALDLVRVQNEAALAAKNLFFNVLLAQANQATQQEQVADATEAVRVASARLGQGVAARFDLLTAQTTLANAQELLSIAQDQYALAQANLDYLLGISPDQPVILQEPPLPPSDETINLAQSTNTALQRRPELRQAETDIAIAQRLVKLAGGTLTPTVGLVGVAGYNSDVTALLPRDTLAVSAQLGVPFDDGGATRSRIRAARIQLQSQVVTRDQLRLSVALEVRAAYLGIIDAQTRTRTATTALGAAQEEVRVANIRYQNGLGTFLDVTNALAQLAIARTNLSNAQYSYQVSLAQLVRALGER